MIMQQLPSSTVRLIGSCQVITSVFSVVKELIENSLDAGATNVDVKLEDYGFSKIEVRDNGVGVPSESTSHMAVTHYTSKINSHNDLSNLDTYGFRGEALGSLCAVSSVTITTKTDTDMIGYTYKLDQNGKVTSKVPSHIGTGTTVVASRLFDNLPVRKQLYSLTKKRREELKKVERLIKAYSLIQHGVRFSLRKDKEVIIPGTLHQKLSSALMSVLGSTTGALLKHYQIADETVCIEAYLPRAGSDVSLTSLTNTESCYVFINRRPVQDKHVEKLLKQYYQSCFQCEKNRCPVTFVSLDLSPSRVDVNLEPNKTRVLVHDKENVYKLLEELLAEAFTKPVEAVEPEIVPQTEPEPEHVQILEPEIVQRTEPEPVAGMIANPVVGDLDLDTPRKLSRDTINDVIHVGEQILLVNRRSERDDVISDAARSLVEDKSHVMTGRVDRNDVIAVDSTSDQRDVMTSSGDVVDQSPSDLVNDENNDQSSFIPLTSSTFVDRSETGPLVTSRIDHQSSDRPSHSDVAQSKQQNSKIFTEFNSKSVVTTGLDREIKIKSEISDEILREFQTLDPDMFEDDYETDLAESTGTTASTRRLSRDARPISMSYRDPRQMEFSFGSEGGRRLSLTLPRRSGGSQIEESSREPGDHSSSRRTPPTDRNQNHSTPPTDRNQNHSVSVTQTKITDLVGKKNTFRTAYQIFCDEQNEESDKILELWEDMNDEEKDKYEQLEVKERERYWYQVMSERKVQHHKQKKRKAEPAEPVMPLDHVISQRRTVEVKYDHNALMRKHGSGLQQPERSSPSLRLIGRVKSIGLWLAVHGTEIILCNQSRVQEVVQHQETSAVTSTSTSNTSDDMTSSSTENWMEMEELLRQYSDICDRQKKPIVDQRCTHDKPCLETVYDMQPLILSQRIQ